MPSINGIPENLGRVEDRLAQCPYVSAWWPPGHGLSYEHGFAHQVVDLVGALAENRQPEPSFDNGLQVQRVLNAVEDSAAHDSSWTQIS